MQRHHRRFRIAGHLVLPSALRELYAATPGFISLYGPLCRSSATPQPSSPTHSRTAGEGAERSEAGEGAAAGSTLAESEQAAGQGQVRPVDHLAVESDRPGVGVFGKCG